MNRRLRIGLLVATSALLLFVVLLAVLPAAVLVRSDASVGRDADPRIDAMRRDRAYLAARVQASTDPLIGLAINPVAETVSIELAGVTLRTVRASSVSIPWTLKAVRPDSVVLLRLVDRTGLIPPEPVRRVDAPADTAEANRAPATVPVETTPSAVNLILERGIVLRIDPDSTGGTAGREVFRYRFMERLRVNTRVVLDAIRFRPAQVRGELRMTMSDADAKAVFRAVSTGSPVAIRTGPAY